MATAAATAMIARTRTTWTAGSGEVLANRPATSVIMAAFRPWSQPVAVQYRNTSRKASAAGGAEQGIGQGRALGHRALQRHAILVAEQQLAQHQRQAALPESRRSVRRIG